MVRVEAQVVQRPDVVLVRVGEHVVTTLYAEDARSEGMSLARYADHIEGRLQAFIPAQLRRQAFQLFFLHVFLSVLLPVAPNPAVPWDFGSPEPGFDADEGELPPGYEPAF